MSRLLQQQSLGLRFLPRSRGLLLLLEDERLLFHALAVCLEASSLLQQRRFRLALLACKLGLGRCVHLGGFALLAKFLLGRFPRLLQGLGLGFVVDFSNSLGFVTGAVLAWLWAKRSAGHANAYTVPTASGLVAGESLFAAVIAIVCAAAST